MLQNELDALAVEESRVPKDAVLPDAAEVAGGRRSGDERERKPGKASVTPAEALEALGEPSDLGADGGLWLSSILREERGGPGGDDEPRS
jgi:hypothetical protein